MGEHLYTYIDPPNPRDLDRIQAVLSKNGVIALSTGTSWAFCADPASKVALARLHKLKPGHPRSLPFAFLCRDVSMASRATFVSGEAFRVLNRIWPGPFTVVLPPRKKLPRALGASRSEVGVRVPDAPLAMLVVERFGKPLVVSSVPRNSEGRLPTMGWEVHEAHGDHLDLVVDLGDEASGTETTVVDLTYGEPEVLREGAGDISLI